MAIALILLFLLTADPVSAEYGRTPPTNIDPALVRIDEESFLGSTPADHTLVTADGSEFALSSLFDGKRPAVLLLSYFSCDGVCPLTNSRLKEMLGEAGLVPGKDLNVLTLSFDRGDTPARIGMFRSMAGLSPELKGWEVAVMKDPAEIKALTERVGFSFFWSPRDRVFVHPNVFIVLSPEGRITRYLYNAVTEENDLKVALAEASLGTSGRSKIEDIRDMFLIACYSYNFSVRRYTVNYPVIIGASSLAFGLALITFSVFRKKKRR